MANISLILYTEGFFGSVLKSPTQMGSLSINNSVTNISRLGTFKYFRYLLKVVYLIKIWFRTFQVPSGCTLRYMTYNVSIPESFFPIIFIHVKNTSFTLAEGHCFSDFGLSQSGIICNTINHEYDHHRWLTGSVLLRQAHPSRARIHKRFGALENLVWNCFFSDLFLRPVFFLHFHKNYKWKGCGSTCIFSKRSILFNRI